MSYTEEPTSQPKLPPPPSYTSIGLNRKFMQIVKDRQKFALGESKFKAKKEECTIAIKRAFVTLAFGVDPDPKSEEFKDLLTAVPDSGEAMCSAAGWRVGIAPGSRKTIDETKLRLALSNYDLSMDQAEEIVKSATHESKWGEIVVEPLVEKKAGRKKVKKAAAKGKKILAAGKSVAAKKPPAPVATPVPVVPTTTRKNPAMAKKASTPAPIVAVGRRRGMIKSQTA